MTEREVREGLLPMPSNDVRTSLWCRGTSGERRDKGARWEEDRGREGDERGRLQEARGEWGRGLAKGKSELKYYCY